jgi:putative membrane protein
LREEELDSLTQPTKYYNLIRGLTFPSLRRVLAGAILMPVIGVGIAFLIATFSANGFFFGCLFGAIALAIPSILVEMAISKFVLNGDPLFYLRRCIALSFAANLVWVAFILVGSVLSGSYLEFPQKSFLLGMACSYSLRCFSVLSLSSCTFTRKMIASLLQPLACLLFGFSFLGLSLINPILLLIPAIVIAPVLTCLLLAFIERKGRAIVAIPLLNLFRSFLTVFLDMRNEPLESHLQELGVVQDVRVDVLMFRRASDLTVKAVIVVSGFHPGPFLNVGSSVLPMLIQNTVEAKTGAVVMVPHGISGHENNVVSQSENQKVLELVGGLLSRGRRGTTASRAIWLSVGAASARSQAFGKCSLATFTMSPKDMEDIPQEVSSTLQSESMGFEEIMLIDSHNCIGQLSKMTSEDIADLVESGRSVLRKVSREEQGPFSVGASKIPLKEFSLDQGVGSCGLSVIIVDTGGHLSAYLTIDGNNMKKGLREKILETAKSMGVDDAEIMTTDSHMVSGRISSKLGYHPIGEAIDNEILLMRIKMGIQDALRNLEKSEMEWNSGAVSVKTLGRSAFENLTMLIRSISKLVAWWVLGIVGIPTLLELMLLR